MSTIFQTEIRASSNVGAVIDESVRSLDGLTVAQKKAQLQIASIIAKGDVTKAVQLEAVKQLKAIEEMERKGKISAEEAAKARQAIHANATAQVVALEQKAAAEVERAHAKSAAAVVPLQQQVKGLKEPLSNVAQLANGLGSAFGAAGSAASQVVTGIAGAFGAGGPVAIALAGTAAAIGLVVTEYRSLREEADAAGRAAAAAQAALSGEIRSRTEQVQNDNRRRELRLAGKNVEATELRSEAERVRGGAEGLDVTAANAEARLAENRRQMAVLEEAAAIRAEKERGTVRTSEQQSVLLEAGQIQTRLGGVTFDTLRDRIKADEEQLRAARESAAAARLEADELERAAKLEEQIAEQAKEKEKAKKGSAAAAKEERDAVREELDFTDGKASADDLAMGGMFFGGSPLEIAKIDKEGRDKKLEKGFRNFGDVSDQDFTKRLQQSQQQQVEDQQRLADQAAGVWKDAGLDAGESFATGLRNYLESKDPADLFGGVLSAAGSILDVFLPGAGRVANFVGGLFEGGGIPHAFALPSGRGGLATGNIDAMPAWLHKREVVFKEDVVDAFPGGLPQAARIGMGVEPLSSLGGGGAPQVHYHQHQSFAPTETRFAYQHHLEEQMRASAADRATPLFMLELKRQVLPERPY